MEFDQHEDPPDKRVIDLERDQKKEVEKLELIKGRYL